MTTPTLIERSLLTAAKLPIVGRFADKQLERRGFYAEEEFQAAFGPDAVRKAMEERMCTVYPETAYLTKLLEDAYDALESAQGVAHELERDHVLEEGMIDTPCALFEIAVLLDRLGRFNASSRPG